MIEILVWSFFVITWLSVGLHIVREFVRHHYPFRRKNGS